MQSQWWCPSLQKLLTHQRVHVNTDAVWAAASGLPWPAIAYMGLATTAFTLWVEMHALKDVSAPLAALIYTCAHVSCC